MAAEVVICAAQSVTRAGIAAMVQTSAIEIVAQLSNLSALNQWLQTQQTDLAIVEVLVPTSENFRKLSALLEETAETFSEKSLAVVEGLSILLLLESAESLDATAQRFLLQLMRSGRVSLLPTSVLAGELGSTIAVILNGLTIIHPDFSEPLFSLSSSAFSPADSELEPLTPREIQVLNQLVDGRSNKAIAQTLKISEHTVKFHISAILSKLQASSRTEAVAVGIRSGLVLL